MTFNLTFALLAALELTPEEQGRIGLLHALVAGYCFFFGATIGSFLNVVVYRMPRGLNVVRPRSRCPVCATPIALRDNIPVLSWLLLRGRCRCCATPISPRYVLVELAVGLLFVGLLYIEVLSGGANLPFRTARPFSSLLTIHWDSMGDLIGIALLHAWLLITLLACTLIQFDGLPVPRRLLLMPLLLGLLLGQASATSTTWPVALLTSLGGLAMGGTLGAILSMAIEPRTDRRQSRTATAMALALLGTMLGWQAALSVACMTGVLWLAIILLTGHVIVAFRSAKGRSFAERKTTQARLLPGTQRAAPLGFLLICSAIQIAAWRTLATLPFWPGSGTGATALVASMLLLSTMTLTIRAVTPGWIARHSAAN